MEDIDRHQDLQVETERGEDYALSGKIMLSTIVVLMAIVVLMVAAHLFSKWYVIRLRRRRIERNRSGHIGLSELLIYIDSLLPSAAADHGLELGVLNSLPVFVYSTKVETPPLDCAVCLSEFKEKEIVRFLPRCTHSFHIECIDKWFHSHSTCPLCRSPVDPVVYRRGPAVKATQPVDKSNGSEPGSSSGSGASTTCPHQEGSGDGDTTSSGNELSQSSPASRVSSLKRILSNGRKSPVGCGSPTTPSGERISPAETELDPENGLGRLNPDPGRAP